MQNNGLSNVEDVIPRLGRISAAPIRPRGQADILKWTGKPLSPYDDPQKLKFLGEPFLLPKTSEAPDVGSIGKGRCQGRCDLETADPGYVARTRGP
jgi:hypothetical protein